MTPVQMSPTHSPLPVRATVPDEHRLTFTGTKPNSLSLFYLAPLHSRSLGHGSPMSALGRIADSTRTSRNVRDVPGGDIAPLHSITSSARASSEAGMSRPSVFAVLRLMTSSNFVGCSTGRSAGLAPLMILSTKNAARRQAVTVLGP